MFETFIVGTINGIYLTIKQNIPSPIFNLSAFPFSYGNKTKWIIISKKFSAKFVLRKCFFRSNDDVMYNFMPLKLSQVLLSIISILVQLLTQSLLFIFGKRIDRIRYFFFDSSLLNSLHSHSNLFTFTLWNPSLIANIR